MEIAGVVAIIAGFGLVFFGCWRHGRDAAREKSLHEIAKGATLGPPAEIQKGDVGWRRYQRAIKSDS